MHVHSLSELLLKAIWLRKRPISHNVRETVEKSDSHRLMENVQMQGFRNPEE